MTPRVGQVMLFWDYDTEWGAERSRSGSKAWGPDEFVNTDRLLELLTERSVPSVFACVGAAALKGERPFHDQDQIRRMHATGHEVASHGFKHEWLPGLNRKALRTILIDSRRALEDCIGAAVSTFVPPWNQPSDFLRVGSISVSERMEARGRSRTDVPTLCSTLSEAGYRFARLAYRGAVRRLKEAIAGRDLPKPQRVRELLGVKYVLLNTPAGFNNPAHSMVERVAREGGLAVLWAHPHSLTADNPQNERHLLPLLDRLVELRNSNLIEFVLPRGLM